MRDALRHDGPAHLGLWSSPGQHRRQRGSPHSPCGKHRLSSNTTALLTSGCGQSNQAAASISACIGWVGISPPLGYAWALYVFNSEVRPRTVVFTVEVPPLRNRPAETRPIVRHRDEAPSPRRTFATYLLRRLIALGAGDPAEGGGLGRPAEAAPDRRPGNVDYPQR